MFCAKRSWLSFFRNLVRLNREALQRQSLILVTCQPRNLELKRAANRQSEIFNRTSAFSKIRNRRQNRHSSDISLEMLAVETLKES